MKERSNAVPDFFIVGAARSGTTSLHQWLRNHPDVCMSWPDKEPGFYCDFWGIEDQADYLANFASATPNQILGDASTHYLTCPSSAGLIHDANPDAKIVISLRNPAKRAYSLFSFMANHGHETASSFEKALKLEEERSERILDNAWKTYPLNYLYFRSGLYFEQVKRYLEQFPKDQVLCLVFEKMLAEPELHLRRLLEFLELPETPVQSMKLPRDNASISCFSTNLQHRITHSLRPALNSIKMPGRDHLVKFLTRLNCTGRPSKAPDPSLLSGLTDRYREDIQRTSDLIDEDLSLWLPD